MKLLTVVLLVTFVASAQEKKLFMEDIIARAEAAHGEDIRISNATITSRTPDGEADGSHVKVTSKIWFQNCRFPDGLVLKSYRLGTLWFFDCEVPGYSYLWDSTIEEVLFSSSSIGVFNVIRTDRQDTTNRIGMFSLYGTIASFTTRKAHIDNLTIGDIPDHALLDSSRFDHVSFEDNSMLQAGVFTANACHFGSLRLSGLVTDLELRHSRIEEDLWFRNLNVAGLLRVIGCELGRHITVNKLAVPSDNIQMAFDQLAGGKLRASSTAMRNIPMLGGDLEEVDFIGSDSLITTAYMKKYAYGRDSVYYNSTLLESLFYNYQRLYNSYRIRGDTESANACYVEMKEIERRRLSFRHSQSPTFKSFFRLHLANILRAYTEYGTDPAKAITISFYVIVIFGVFYFFFPSDWDVSSKSKLVERYRELVERNAKGYVKPFFMLLGGFLVSFVNAVTLSLNSFTTLGFGNIPTHGLARYVCVVQGFIGWFLLSIFTVALINQA